MDDNIIINATEILEKQENTLQVAIAIQQLLTNLNDAYNNGLQEIKDLGGEIKKDIDIFYANSEKVLGAVNEVKSDLDQAIAEMETLKPKIQEIIELGAKTDASLTRLEEINQNVINIEQEVKNAVAGLDLVAFKNNVDAILEDALGGFNDSLAANANAIKEQVLYLINESTRGLNALVSKSLSDIEKAKNEALDAIGQVANTGRVAVLLEYDAMLLFSRVTLNKVKIDRERYNKIGMEAVFHTSSYPSSYVPLGTELTTKDYPILYKKSGVKAVDGKFTIGLPKENTYIYTGKGV